MTQLELIKALQADLEKFGGNFLFLFFIVSITMYVLHDSFHNDKTRELNCFSG